MAKERRAMLHDLYFAGLRTDDAQRAVGSDDWLATESGAVEMTSIMAIRIRTVLYCM